MHHNFLSKKYLFILTVLLQSSMVFAFKLSPIVERFDHKGKGATKSFKVFNPSNKSILLEIEPKTRSVDIHNKETREDTEAFLIYPPQLTVKPGESRAIRVTYTGKEVKHEEAFRLIVRQLPSRLKEKSRKNKNNFDFLFEYVASLYVLPGDVKPDLKVLKAVIKNKKVLVEFENKGTEHVLLKQYKLKLQQGKKSVFIEFTDPKFKKYATYNILAKSKRNIEISAPKSFLNGKTKVYILPK